MNALLIYGLLQILILIMISYHEYVKEASFYALLIGTVQSNGLHLLHILSLIFIIYLSSKFIFKAVFGSFRRDELASINDHCFLFLTDTLLVITIFSDELSLKNLVIFSILVALKIASWLVRGRAEIEAGSQRSFEFMDLLNLFNILLCSCLFAGFLASSLARPNISILFAFEFAMVLLAALRNAVTSCIEALVIMDDQRTSALLLCEIGFSALRTACYLLFFVATSMFYRIPFNVFREIVTSIRGLTRKIANYRAYMQVSRTLDECTNVYNAGPCPICRDEMDVGKEIICGHVFHLSCLRSWVERQQVCPICRATLFDNPEEVNIGTETEDIRGIRVEPR
ncbi:ERAD-associated E3 ubiquitin-protein ligase HRD1A [Astathelohania contejeani]|uniref:RING-type E3 ubiquitin transferase n=1 Tax=Astathelohania contejeani TaxID=164912 RepID=A0ABQ7HZ13_9MICR|nr:ERAD-associated E3 ubiquitin-protein ligase HRD1A [Thelohania contejeani]